MGSVFSHCCLLGQRPRDLLCSHPQWKGPSWGRWCRGCHSHRLRLSLSQTHGAPQCVHSVAGGYNDAGGAGTANTGMVLPSLWDPAIWRRKPRPPAPRQPHTPPVQPRPLPDLAQLSLSKGRIVKGGGQASGLWLPSPIPSPYLGAPELRLCRQQQGVVPAVLADPSLPKAQGPRGPGWGGARGCPGLCWPDLTGTCGGCQMPAAPAHTWHCPTSGGGAGPPAGRTRQQLCLLPGAPTPPAPGRAKGWAWKALLASRVSPQHPGRGGQAILLCLVHSCPGQADRYLGQRSKGTRTRPPVQNSCRKTGFRNVPM